MEHGPLTDRIVEAFDGMPAQLRTAARYVLDKPNDVALLSMREQARQIGWRLRGMGFSVGPGSQHLRELLGRKRRQCRWLERPQRGPAAEVVTQQRRDWFVVTRCEPNRPAQIFQFGWVVDVTIKVVVIEFPFGEPAYDIMATFYAGYHRKPLVNGTGACSVMRTLPPLLRPR